MIDRQPANLILVKLPLPRGASITVYIPGSMTLEIGTLSLETAIMGKLRYHESDAKALLGIPEDIATA